MNDETSKKRRKINAFLVEALMFSDVDRDGPIKKALELVWREDPPALLRFYEGFQCAIKNLEELFGKEFFKEGK